VRVAEVDGDVGRNLEVRVRGHLLALVPRQRPPELFGELDDLRRDRVPHCVGLRSVGSGTSSVNLVVCSTIVAI
jgi:hypothetical protein